MEKLDDLKNILNKEQLEKYVYWSFLEIELGKTIFCTVEYFDDLYTCLDGGVLCNFGKGRIPEYMEGIGTSIEDRNSLESFHKMRSHLSVEYGRYVYDFDKWLNDNPESDEWFKFIEKSIELTKKFENNPIQWCIEMREKMIDNQFKTK